MKRKLNHLKVIKYHDEEFKEFIIACKRVNILGKGEKNG